MLRSVDGQQIGVLPHPVQEDGSPPFVLDWFEEPFNTVHVYGCKIFFFLLLLFMMYRVAAARSVPRQVWTPCPAQRTARSWPGPAPIACSTSRTLTQSGTLSYHCGHTYTTAVSMMAACPVLRCVVGIPDTNGDFLTAGHDGVLRHFSRDPVKTARSSSTQLTDQLAQEVQEAVIKRKRGPSSEELAKATKWEDRGLRQHTGKSENQVMVFNKDGKMIAAQWMSGSWVEVGEVTGSSDGGYVGSEFFDHVLPVEMETPRGLRSLNLGYNNGENPFVAAQRFINQNELGQNYLQEIADWIIAR